MRKFLGALLILILMVATVNAQGPPKPFNIYAGVGMTFGSGPDEFRDFHKEGYHMFGGLGLNLIPVIQFVGKVEYHSFSKDFDMFLPDVTDLDGGTRRVLMFGVDARLGVNVPTAPVSPFLLAGIGLARSSESDFATVLEELTDDEIAILDYENQTDFYFNIGGGIEFKFLEVLNMFVQGKYVAIKQDGDNLSFIPISVGLKF